MSLEPRNLSTSANIIMTAELCAKFADGSTKYLTIHEGDIIRDLEYKSGNTINKIDGIIKIINFNSIASNSAAIQSCLEKSTSVFTSMVKIVSLVVDTSETYKSDVVNIPIGNIINFKADRYVNEKYQGTVYEVTPETDITATISEMADGDTLLLDAGSYENAIEVNKAIRITPKKDDQGVYGEVIINKPITFSATEGTIEVDHITIKDLTSAEGTGPDKTTAKGSGLIITGDAEVNLHDNVFDNFNNFYANIQISSAAKITITDNIFSEGMSYHVIEAGGTVKVADVTIKNNTFGNICKHNIISFYDYAEDAVINIEDNKFAYSANAIRISNVNSVNATFNIARNTYDSTDATSTEGDPRCSADTYAGLVILQDYTGNQDFTKITLNYSENYYTPVDADVVLVTEDSKNETQPYYVWVDRADWAITLPVVNFNN